ncbi:hypothetical protein CLV92_1102 [Kineococcus xinjiangensis]|uniref:Uncharacterized protein n=1 Tax=Kineococcus xinjiangensis TaxID=512762 RepID=A0A2S6IGM9_9ACTN|nr:hypothetical protein [Kineococcus xinjiangensis]PPK93374.1 hypothetical protein CLV92_1102 [Kineococcus xinjiangensis]
MALTVRVQEYSGTLVEEDCEHPYSRLVDVAAATPADFPLLAGVDRYDDTIFNPRQCRALLKEVQALMQQVEDKDLRRTAERLSTLADLVIPSRDHRTTHRRLWFNGD